MINSKGDCEDCFTTGDWLQYGGKDQSSFFSVLAYQSFPDWLKEELLRHSWELFDYGCAEGSGTCYLAKKFPSCKVTGVDFSEEAIKIAKETHADCGFILGDITGGIVACDVIFCSNALERFRDPIPLLHSLVNAATKYAILLLPFEDDSGIVEHVSGFPADRFPDTVGTHYLSNFQVIDCRRIPNSYWLGSQLLLVYTNADYKQKRGYTFSQIYSDTIAPLMKNIDRLADHVSEEQTKRKQVEGELIDVRAKVSANETELLETFAQQKQSMDQLITGLNTALSEKNAALSKIKAESRELVQKQDEWEAKLSFTQEQLREDEEKISNALWKLQEMTRFKSFKLLHVWTRFRRQGLSNIKHERKNFRCWIFSHFNHTASYRDHRFHYLYSVINILNETSSKNTEGESYAAGLQPIDIQTQAGELAEYLRMQDAGFTQALTEPLSAEADKLRVVFADRDYKGILVYPHIVFWEPLKTPQQILRGFAKQGWLCLFCESPYTKDACREVEPNLFITYEKDALQAIADTPVTLLLTWMGSLSFVDHIPNKTVWYHILDHPESSLYYDQFYSDLHNQTLKIANAVSYVARPLRVYTGAQLDAQYLPNGVNATEISDIHPEFVPKDMKPILEKKHKIIGFFGYLAEWMDYDMVRQIALRRPDWEFVMVGKAIHDLPAISDLPNVHLLGLKPYKELSDYAKFFDVTIIPFLVGERMDCVSPIKFYEYLALGKPVVSSAMDELAPYAQRFSFVACAVGVNEFLTDIENMMLPDTQKEAKVHGPIIAKANAWASRVEQMEPILLNQHTSILDTAYTKPDIIVLSIIDYSFRHQRPQHIAKRLAEAGHRVYYVNAYFAENFALTYLEERLWQVVLAVKGRLPST